jgi:hypothetical protein
LPVPLIKVHAKSKLATHNLTLVACLYDCLSSHAAGLGSEIDALAGALGDVSSSVTNKRYTVLYALWAGVFWDGVGLDLEDLSALGLYL